MIKRGTIGPGRTYRQGLVALCATLSLGLVGLTAAGPAHAGPPGSETQDDFAGVADFDAVLGAAQASFGDRYGGAFIDRTVNPPVLRVTVVDPTAVDADALVQIAGSNPRVQLGSASRSKPDLDRAAGAIEAELSASMDGQQWSVGVNDVTHKVDVSANQLSDLLRTRLSALAPADTVSFDIAATNGFTEQAACRSCYPPYEAGLVARLLNFSPPSVATCTSGFAVRRDGNNYGTTAGHCGRTGSFVQMGANIISQVGINSYFCCSSRDQDVTRFFIPASAARPRVYTAPGSFRTVIGQYSNAALTIGRALCFQGAVSGNNNCGLITVRDRTVNTSRGPTRHQWCVDLNGSLRSLSGDSGGPFYGVQPNGSARAAGLLSGELRLSTGPVTCFSTINYALQFLGGALLTG